MDGTTTVSFVRTHAFAGQGSDPGQFVDALRGLALDNRDRIVAAGDSAVQVYDGAGLPVARWSTAAPALSVAVADDGSIYVGEAGAIEIFDAAGAPRAGWRNAERLGRVTAIGFVDGAVLAADADARCIRRFDLEGRFLNNIGKNNRMRGFRIPNGDLDFTVDATGLIHAANPGMHRVERYTPDGELLGRIGRFDGRDPEGFPGCCNPTNVTLGAEGHLYVTEKAPPRAKILDREGQLVAVIATDEFHPACKNMDIAVDSSGNVFVTDTVTLQIFAFEPVAAGRSDS